MFDDNMETIESITKYFRDEIVSTYETSMNIIKKAEVHYNKVIQEKTEKYIKLKESIKDTTFDMSRTRMLELENMNMKELLEYILPQNIEQDLEWDLADINVDETVDYITAHILEIPIITQQAS